MRRFIAVAVFAALIAGCSGASGGGYPDDNALLHAANDNADWLVPGKTYMGNRYTGLDQITPDNVSHLRKAWVTPVRDDGEEEASPIVARYRLRLHRA